MFDLTDEQWGNLAPAHAFAVQMANAFVTVSRHLPRTFPAHKKTTISAHDKNGRIAATVTTEVPERAFPIGRATREFWEEATKTARQVDAAYGTRFGVYLKLVSAAIDGNPSRSKTLAKTPDARKFLQQVDYWHGRPGSSR